METRSGARFAVGVGSGTDAIALALRALGIGAGDEVVTAPLSAAYSALAIMMTGARPVFFDIDGERMTIDPAQVESAITSHTRAIVPVHLYGQPAAMRELERIAARHHLAVVEDCCQAHLATESGRPVGTIGIAGAFSFYPTKNLGALGDGGAVKEIEDSDALIAAMIALVHKMIAHFGNPATPYAALPWPEFGPYFNDYKHLERVAEWASIASDESAT